MTNKQFKTQEQMSEHQADRELQEALRVQEMDPDTFSAWFESTMGALQERARLLYGDLPKRPPAVHQFASMDEKNRFDEAREIEFALRCQRVFHSGLSKNESDAAADSINAH